MEKKKHHHHSAKERQVAFGYLKQGKTIRETAELCGVSTSTIKNRKRTFRFVEKGIRKNAKYPYASYPEELKCHVVQDFKLISQSHRVIFRYRINESFYQWIKVLTIDQTISSFALCLFVVSS